jgi:hypothetical protein
MRFNPRALLERRNLFDGHGKKYYSLGMGRQKKRDEQKWSQPANHAQQSHFGSTLRELALVESCGGVDFKIEIPSRTIESLLPSHM